ncbi:MAG: methyltransferase domain-containing protein [Bacteroidetes bacterium]|nr:methyltransferase domain-containing protein [Bacteroidota bacterium]
MTKEFWNSRYAEESFAYGVEPNAFFKEQLTKLKPGKILIPGDGEGRNGVYAATQGWEVSSFDLSSEGKRKAELLAKEKGVQIDYRVGELAQMDYPEEYFDALLLVFAHFPEKLRKDYHHRLIKFLKKGGVLIIEGFSKEHLEYSAANPKSGGPKDIGMLYSEDEIRSDFQSFNVRILSTEVVELQEGLFHQGTSSLIRFVGTRS